MGIVENIGNKKWGEKNNWEERKGKKRKLRNEQEIKKRRKPNGLFRYIEKGKREMKE